MFFAFHWLQSRQQYFNEGMAKYFNNVTMSERFWDWNTLKTQPNSSLAALTIFLILNLKGTVIFYIIIMFSTISQMIELAGFELHIVCIVQRCTVYVNNFVASGCLLHLLFL